MRTEVQVQRHRRHSQVPRVLHLRERRKHDDQVHRHRTRVLFQHKSLPRRSMAERLQNLLGRRLMRHLRDRQQRSLPSFLRPHAQERPVHRPKHKDVRMPRVLS